MKSVVKCFLNKFRQRNPHREKSVCGGRAGDTTNESGTVCTLLNIRYFCLRVHKPRLQQFYFFPFALALSSSRRSLPSCYYLPCYSCSICCFWFFSSLFFAIPKSMVIERLLKILIPFVLCGYAFGYECICISNNMCMFFFCRFYEFKRIRSNGKNDGENMNFLIHSALDSIQFVEQLSKEYIYCVGVGVRARIRIFCCG